MMKGLIAAALLVGAVSAQADDSALAESFGYAMQAASQCDELNMRMDTEGAVSDKLGEPVRDAEGYKSGLFGAINADDAGENICQVAWQKYGCGGTEVKGLVQQNPFTQNNPVLCEYQ